jgi:hypothetical protein
MAVKRLASAIAAGAALLVFAGLAVSAQGEPSTSILWQGQVAPDLSSWTALQAKSGSFAVVPAPDGRAGVAARFTVRPGDMPVGTSGERSELLKATDEHDGVESFWTWAVDFPRSFVSNPNASWNVFTQWHQGSNVGVQPVSFEIENARGKEYLRFRAWGGNPASPTRRAWRLGVLKRDHWYDIAFHVVWAPDNRGLVEVWVDGARVVKPTHTPTLYQGDGVYLKQGFYRAPSPYTTTLYIAGTTRLSRFVGLLNGGVGRHQPVPGD